MGIIKTVDKIFEDSDFIQHRFSCQCGYPGHIMDISLEMSGDSKIANLSVDVLASTFEIQIKTVMGCIERQRGMYG